MDANDEFEVSWFDLDELDRQTVLQYAPWNVLNQINEIDPDLVASTCGAPTELKEIAPPFTDTDAESFKDVCPYTLRIARDNNGNAVPLELYLKKMKNFRPMKLDIANVKLTMPHLKSLLSLGASQVRLDWISLTPPPNRLGEFVNYFQDIETLKLYIPRLKIEKTDIEALISQLTASYRDKKILVSLKGVNYYTQQSFEPGMLDTEKIRIEFKY